MQEMMLRICLTLALVSATFGFQLTSLPRLGERRCCYHVMLSTGDDPTQKINALLDGILADGFFTSAAESALEALEAVEVDYDGYDIDPAGSWRILSFYTLGSQLLKHNVPLKSLSSCVVQVSDGGPANFQNDMSLSMTIQPIGQGEEVQLSFRGVLGLSEEHAGVVFLRADVAAPPGESDECSEAALDAAAESVAPSLPPGAIRAQLKIAWIDETICVLREPMGEGASTPVLPRPGGVIVLQRISPPPSEDVPDAVFEEGPESDDANYDDEEDGTRNIWVGSPY